MILLEYTFKQSFDAGRIDNETAISGEVFVIYAETLFILNTFPINFMATQSCNLKILTVSKAQLRYKCKVVAIIFFLNWRLIEMLRNARR